MVSFAVQARGNDRPADAKAEAAAREHVRKAAEAFQAGRYDEALVEFEAGYAAVPRPAFLLNMGHAARKSGNAARARECYRRYLDLEPGSPQRGEIEKAIAEIDAGHGGAPAAKPSNRPAAAASGGGRQHPPVVPAAAGTDSEIPSDLKLAAREPIRKEKEADEGPAFYQQWWFWGTVAGVIAAGAVAFFVLRSGGDDYTTSGTWGTLGR
jgi:tetratricopeptide (TPR) repeat protein